MKIFLKNFHQFQQRMTKHQQIIKSIDEIATKAKKTGIAHLYTEDSALKKNLITINGKETINFGSCSYLGLEFDKRLIAGSQDAVARYGTQFSASRAYVSCGLYEKLEYRLEQIFDGPCLVAPTTTLGHIATIPVVVGCDDAVILDHQVHSSVQNAVQLLRPRGIKVEMIRHNHMQMLEDRIVKLRSKYKRIWYMADGIYSMYGDRADAKSLIQLTEKYPELMLYVDDAHGMSCFGTNGNGSIRDEKTLRPRMILATSLNKAFASGGSVFVFPNQEMNQLVRNCGGPMITSGPMQPGSLGAAIACSDIHLSNEIIELQEELESNIQYTNVALKKLGIPLIVENNSPIFFVGVGLPKVGYNLVSRMTKEGFYQNLGVFPAVPMKNTGLRFTITALHNYEQIEAMAQAMAYHYPRAVHEENFSIDKVYWSFGLERPDEKKLETELNTILAESQLSLEHQETIYHVDQTEWDAIFLGKGSFDWEGLLLLEKSFCDNELEEHNWDFDYLTVRDQSGKPVVATFTSTGLSKDDMLSDANVSKVVEDRRRCWDKYYLTSRVLSIGSMLTVGDHLYVDYTNPLWRNAVEMVLSKINDLQDVRMASTIMLRDFISLPDKLHELINENGFFKIETQENNIIRLPAKTDEQLLSSVSKKARKYLKKLVFPFRNNFRTKVVRDASIGQIEHWYDLYMNVKNSSLEVNTFDLPFKLFCNQVKDPNWEMIEIFYKESSQADAVVFCHVGGEGFSPLMIGLNYDYSGPSLYLQALYHCVRRGAELGKQVVYLGVTCSFNKQRFGAESLPMFGYVQVKDHYNMAVLETVSAKQAK